uniref:Uncharacterized protein n=1 Tax=Salix viminalis TaxID=40686 RepID=A0A6N2LCP1_SALVM
MQLNLVSISDLVFRLTFLKTPWLSREDRELNRWSSMEQLSWVFSTKQHHAMPTIEFALW